MCSMVIVIERSAEPEKGVDYPRCLTGRRAGPPEDCGGPWGYAEFLDAIRDPAHEQHAELKEWIGCDFDPDHVDSQCCATIWMRTAAIEF